MPQNLSGTPLIGRDDELTRLAGVLGWPRVREARAVLIAGDAGVCKTWVLSEAELGYTGRGWLRCETDKILGVWNPALTPLTHAAAGLDIPDDLAFEDWPARLDTLADAHQRLREGEQVSGPAAETYRHRVQAAARFAGRVLRIKRHANAKLSNPDVQIFPGKGMTCVLDPKRAACRLRSEEDGPRRTPTSTTAARTASTSRDVGTPNAQEAYAHTGAGRGNTSDHFNWRTTRSVVVIARRRAPVPPVGRG